MNPSLTATIAIANITRYVETEWESTTSQEKLDIHRAIAEQLKQAEDMGRSSALGAEIKFSEHYLIFQAEAEHKKMLKAVNSIQLCKSRDINAPRDVQERLQRVNAFIQLVLPGCGRLERCRDGVYHRRVGCAVYPVVVGLIETLAPKDRKFKISGLRFSYRDRYFEELMGGQQVLDSGRILSKLEQIDEMWKLRQEEKKLELGLNELIQRTTFKQRGLAQSILPRGNEVILDISNLRLRPEVAAIILETIEYSRREGDRYQ